MVEQVMAWIATRVRLPPYRERVLISCRTLNELAPCAVRIAYRNHTDAEGEHWMDDNASNELRVRVMAWMPLPEFYDGN